MAIRKSAQVSESPKVETSETQASPAKKARKPRESKSFDSRLRALAAYANKLRMKKRAEGENANQYFELMTQACQALDSASSLPGLTFKSNAGAVVKEAIANLQVGARVIASGQPGTIVAFGAKRRGKVAKVELDVAKGVTIEVPATTLKLL